MGHFWEIQLFGLDVHFSTLIMVWAAMAVLLGFAFLSTRQLSVVPGHTQTVGELFYDFCRSITFSTAGARGDGYLFFIGSLFLFILTANLMGQLPLKLIHIPQGELVAGTADFSTTLALALLSVIMYFAIGLSRKGLSYFKHYFQPFWWMLPLNMLEDITRPMSLSMRLYFNLLVGEILSMLTLKILPVGLPCAVIAFELLVALIQAYVFALLSAVYISLVADEHH
ncbi:MAG: F0F1 ATP synthase subunit A [Cyanobacteria bacterium]|nr:F0F1 ATP synthase subunit A [Cyanobacteriota bacterium]